MSQIDQQLQQLQQFEERVAVLEVGVKQQADALGQRLDRLEGAVAVAGGLNLSEFDTPDQVAARVAAVSEGNV
jgi:hypothetical protein